MSRQTDDVQSFGGATADAFASAAGSLLQGVAFLIMLFLLEWHLALGGTVLVAVVLGLQVLVSKPLRARSKAAQESWTRFSQILHQGITGHYLVQPTASEKSEARRFAGALHDGVRASVKRDVFALWTNHLMFLITGVAPTLIILAGA
jgi:subfamily B ATP-binding cassette protein MsbA